jgi:hypothetical protein
MQAAIAPPPPVPTVTRPSANTQSPAPVIPSSSKPKGMQLGVHKTSVPGYLPGGLTEEARWGGDLMDVNADADDWSTYHLLTSKSHAPTQPTLTYTQMHSRACRVPLTPSRGAGPMRQTTKIPGERSKNPYPHLCLSRSRNLHHHRYLPDHHYQPRLLRERFTNRSGRPHESQCYRPPSLRALARHHWHPRHQASARHRPLLL